MHIILSFHEQLYLNEFQIILYLYDVRMFEDGTGNGKGKGNGKVYLTTGHEGSEGE